MNANLDLRKTFDNEAELYHLIRPRYPEALVDALIKTTCLSDHARLLEIGPGTGQATEALAERGYDITAVELGPELARVCQKALRRFPNVRVINAAFESVRLPSQAFDLVYVATALHWVEPESRFKKPYKLLKPDGYFVVIDTVHVSDDDGDRFFFASQPIYEKHYPDKKHDDDFRPSGLGELEPRELDETLFTPVYFNAFPLVVRYSAGEFVSRTPHRNLAERPVVGE